MRLSDNGQALIKQYKFMHDNSKRFRGMSLKHHIKDIDAMVKYSGAKTLLDYGCGKGEQYSLKQFHEGWGNIMPTLYDPAFNLHDSKPVGKFDGVISTDVLEHVAEEDVVTVLLDIFNYASKFVFLCIFTAPSRKLLPDGRNCHVTVKSEKWWNSKIELLRPSNLIIKTVYRK